MDNFAFNKVEPVNIDVNKEEVRQQINVYLHRELAQDCLTPYIGLERVRRVLAYYSIHLPQVNFLEGDHGVETFEVNQFGAISGMNDKGEVVTKDPLPYELYFEYKITDGGLYKIFCEIVDEDELDDLLDDAEEDFNDESAEDDREEELSEAKLTKKPLTDDEKAARRAVKSHVQKAMVSGDWEGIAKKSYPAWRVNRKKKKDKAQVANAPASPDTPKPSFKDLVANRDPNFVPSHLRKTGQSKAERRKTRPNIQAPAKPSVLARFKKLVKLAEESSTD